MSFGSPTVRQIASKEYISTGDVWERPSEWPSLTPVGPSESKFTALLAILPNDADNLASFTWNVSGGGGSQYTVNWGDGSTENVNHATQVTHQYTYSSIPGSPTSYGYKVVTVTVTPTTGGQTFTSGVLRIKPAGAGSFVTYAHKWLDIEVGSPGLTALTTGGNNSTAQFPFCQRFRLASKNASWTNFFEQFYYWSSLQQIIFDADMSNVTNFTATFYVCSNLRFAPYIDTGNVTSMSFMFGDCTNLISVPAYNLSKVTDMSNMFINCRRLLTVPLFNTANVTTMNTTFFNCNVLETIPPINAVKVTSMNQVFGNCFGLKTITMSNCQNVTTFNSAFLNCSNLVSTSITGTPTGNVLLSSMFSGCSVLKDIELFDTSRGNNFSSMFSGCGALEKLPNINAGGPGIATNMASFALSCRSLVDFSGLSNTGNIQTFTSAFNGCRMMTIAPNISTNGANTVTNMFNNTGLTGMPNYNLANVTSGGGLFIATGSGLESTPLMYSNIQGIRFSHTYTSCGLNKDNLENAFANVGSAGAAGQIIVITNNPGSDTALSKTATWTNTSNVMTMANTVGVSVGTQITGANIANALAITVNANNTITATSYIDNATYIAFANVTTTNLSANTRYWTSNRVDIGSGNYTYELSASNGGATLTFTSGSANMLVNRIVTTVNTNSNVILSAFPSNNGTAATATTRVLNTNIATFRGFGITG